MSIQLNCVVSPVTRTQLKKIFRTRKTQIDRIGNGYICSKINVSEISNGIQVDMSCYCPQTGDGCLINQTQLPPLH